MALKATLIALLAITVGIYKIYLHDLVVLVSGIGRVIQPLSDFPQYQCHRLTHPLLESCEDLWLDHTSRKLYAACSNPAVRAAWSPGGNTYDLAGRAAGGGATDHITVLDIDHPGADGLHGVRALPFRDQHGSAGQEVDLHGFDARVIDHGRRLRFWLINHRPPMDGLTGELLEDATGVGANSTVEIYDLDVRGGADHLVHVKTILADAIVSPNNLVVVDDEGDFLVTNDHTTRASTSMALGLFLGLGSVSYCSSESGECHFASTGKVYLPNGITRNPASGLVYLAESGTGSVTVHQLTEDRRLVKIDQVPLGMSLDNVSIDPEGNVFAAAFPDIRQFMKAFHDPYGTVAPSTVMMIRKRKDMDGTSGGKDRYEVVKVVEDRDAEVLPTTTTAVQDPVSGRLFLGGVSSTFLGVCERQT
ncbi:hypothetical protein FE257_010742 [Aspergillus nanangensis]|uniref:Calcium-dependent phosphotriesterase n=1 Tax=Aspergillus nanangensis TaxID=2582783 RepID=A0AAD4CVE4_ASPNN|nr:hypothetical protein FE257_010742 [Aspergillus nanangensis]